MKCVTGKGEGRGLTDNWYILRFARGLKGFALGKVANEQVSRRKDSGQGRSRLLPVTRRGFHALIGLILLVCVICPYVETALDWNESIFTTGYDTESTVGIIALLVILSLAFAKLLAAFLPKQISDELIVASHPIRKPEHVLASATSDFSLPVPLRI
jgi:hypothetical protein